MCSQSAHACCWLTAETRRVSNVNTTCWHLCLTAWINLTHLPWLERLHWKRPSNVRPQTHEFWNEWIMSSTWGGGQHGNSEAWFMTTGMNHSSRSLCLYFNSHEFWESKLFYRFCISHDNCLPSEQTIQSEVKKASRKKKNKHSSPSFSLRQTFLVSPCHWV